MKRTSVSILKEMQSQRLDHHYKRADDNKQSFEKNFYNLAEALAQENFPTIKEYDLGFQLIDKEKDNTRAFGVKAYRLRTLVFVPFFYDNGEVHGYELLYLPVQNIFLPNTSTWISYLKAKDKPALGAVSDKYRNLYGTSYANLIPLRRPLVTKTSSWMIKHASDIPEYTYQVPDAVRSSNILAKAFVVLIDQFPFIAEKCARCYGVGFLKQALDKAKEEQYINKYPYSLKDEKVRFFTQFDDTSNLRKHEVEKLLKVGYFVKDARTDNEKSKIVPSVKELNANVVSKSGIYDIINADGIISKKVVLRDIGHNNDSNALFIINDDKAQRVTGRLYHVGQYPTEDWDAFWEKAKKITPSDLIKRLQKVQSESRPVSYGSGTLILFDKHGNALRVREYDNLLQVQEVESNKISKVHPIHTKSHLFAGGRETLLLPKEVGYVEEAPENFYGGDPLLFDQYLQKEAKALKIYYDPKNGDSFIINKVRLDKLPALKHLMTKWGLDERISNKLLREAIQFKQVRYWVKLAEPYKVLQEEAPSISFFENPRSAFAPGYTGEEGYEVSVWVPGLKRPQPIGNIMEPPPKTVIDTLSRLSQTNDGEVFDLTLLTTLLHSARGYSVVEKYLPKVISGLDAMARILFGMYRHKAELEEHFGKEDYQKLVDSLRSNIENIGDLAMDLSQQEIDPYLKELESSESEEMRIENG